MKRMKNGIFAWAGALALTLSACGGGGQQPPDAAVLPQTADPQTSAGPVDGSPWFAVYRVVDGAESGSLLLAENGGGTGAICRLNTEGLELDAPVEDGQLINVYFESILETYPAEFGGVSRVEHTETARDDRCGLYLQMLEDLWVVDPGLNTGITQLGVDLSGVTDLSEAEKSAVAWRFGELHDIVPLESTWDELADQGYIDRETLYWEDGCLFTVTGAAEQFNAQKWASGLGAYFHFDCTGNQNADGTWTYEVGSAAVS